MEARVSFLGLEKMEAEEWNRFGSIMMLTKGPNPKNELLKQPNERLTLPSWLVSNFLLERHAFLPGTPCIPVLAQNPYNFKWS